MLTGVFGFYQLSARPMLRALVLALSLLAFLVLPVTSYAREASRGAAANAKPVAVKSATKKKDVARNKKVTASKKKAFAKTVKKTVIQAKQERGITARRVAARPVSLQEMMGEPYTGGELVLSSSSVLVVDQNTSEILYAKNPHKLAPIASITKLMMAMVTLDAGLPLTEEITIGPEDVDRLKRTRSRLAIGTTLTREELLYMALVASDNRAAAALSRAYPGGRPAFIEAMNRKARELGMINTRFVDGTGLSSENQSTAADLVKLVDAAYHYPLIRRMSTTGSYNLFVFNSNQVHHLLVNNTNALTRQDDWEIGISKTGYLSEAGHCLVMQAKIAGRKVIIVLLDSWNKFSRIDDVIRIRQWLEYGGLGRLAGRSSKA